MSATETERKRAREAKIRVLVEEASKLNQKTWRAEMWRAKLLEASRKRCPEITPKFLTTYADDVPKPRLRGRD